jgi:hypothetical protein
MFFLLITLGWLRARRKSKRTSQEEEMQMIIQKYQKNEEGEYPWETDTDDDPRSIKEDAKIVNLDALPKRGRWKT